MAISKIRMGIIADVVPVSIEHHKEFTGSDAQLSQLEDRFAGVKNGQFDWYKCVGERLKLHKDIGVERMNNELTSYERGSRSRSINELNALQKRLQWIYNETVGTLMDEQLSGYVEGIRPPEDKFKLPPEIDSNDYEEERGTFGSSIRRIIPERFLRMVYKPSKAPEASGKSFTEACNDSYKLNNMGFIIKYLKLSFELTAGNLKKVLQQMP